jgi:ribosome maturation factor RimP
MKKSAVSAALEPVVASLGLELDAVEIRSAGKRDLLRISLDGDGPQGRGPDLDQIAEATRAISRTLDDSGVAGEKPYVLEVGTRGATKPLHTPAQFRRNRDRLVVVDLADGTQLTGRISAADDTDLSLDTETGIRQVGFSQISKGVVQIEFNAPRPADTGDQGAPEEEEED